MNTRREKRCQTPLKIILKLKDNETILGKITDFSLNGLKAVFKYVGPECHSYVDLMIQKPNKDVFVPASAEIRWKKHVAGKCQVGLKLGKFDPEIHSEILTYYFAKQKRLSYLKKLILLMVTVFMILYFMLKTEVAERVVLPKVAIAKVAWSSFSERISKKMHKIFPKRYRINSIWYSADNTPHATINGNIYLLNDSVCGGKIIKISKTEVTIQFQDKEEVYKIGDIIKK